MDSDKRFISLAQWLQYPGEKHTNQHSLFRKEFTVDAQAAAVKLIVTADDCCRMYINGHFVNCGPAPGYLYHYHYQTIDVSPYLTPGKNCIAIHLYYQGLKNRVWNSGDGLSGLKAALSNGMDIELFTDSSWKCLDVSAAYASNRTFGYDTQFAEDIDLRRLPRDWHKSGFDDSSWLQACVAASMPHVLVPQTIPPLEWRMVTPVKLTQLPGEGRWLADFGREVVGCTMIGACGQAGSVVEVRHAEELDNDGFARFQMRANCVYQEYITLSGKPGEIVEFFDYKAFRYLELLNYPGNPHSQIHVRERCHPLPSPAIMESSNPILDRIWGICALAVRLGTQDSYLDCMSREKGAYLGDAYVTGISHLHLGGDGTMLRKVLNDFALSARQCPGLRAVAPGSFEQDIADYSLLYLPLLVEYFQWTGDLAFIRSLESVVDGLLRYFEHYRDGEGLLRDFTAKPIMVDWPTNLRDDYDDPALMGSNNRQQGVNTLINIYYYGTLDAAAKLYASMDETDKAAGYREQAVGLAAAIKGRFLREMGFVDREGSEHISLHPNALALMFNMLSPEEAAPVIALIKEKRICCGVYFAYFLLKGLCNYGESAFAYELMTCDDIHSWRNMLKDGATTCMEAWGLDQKWNTSLCHPWASAPISITASELFGLKAASPGWRSITFNPCPPRDMSHGQLSMPTPVGTVHAAFIRKEKCLLFELRLPSGCELAETNVPASQLTVISASRTRTT